MICAAGFMFSSGLFLFWPVFFFFLLCFAQCQIPFVGILFRRSFVFSMMRRLLLPWLLLSRRVDFVGLRACECFFFFALHFLFSVLSHFKFSIALWNMFRIWIWWSLFIVRLYRRICNPIFVSLLYVIAAVSLAFIIYLLFHSHRLNCGFAW